MAKNGTSNAGSAKGVVAAVTPLALRVAEETGCILWDTEYVKEGAQRVLRFTIDKPEGVNIDDCERFHRAIDPLLDELDPISEAYQLEVSSPGLERDLRTDAQIAACEGWDVEVRLYAPDESGAKSYRGRLAGITEDGRVRITGEDGSDKSFDRSAVAKLMTVCEF